MKKILLALAIVALALTGCSSNSSSTTTKISADEAEVIALNDVGANAADVNIKKVELDDGKYEVEFIYNNIEYDYRISATDGSIIGSTSEAYGNTTNMENEAITAEEAQLYAIKDAGATSANDVTFVYVEQDGMYYEVDFIYNGVEFEYIINMQTGDIVSVEKDIEVYTTVYPSAVTSITLAQAKAIVYQDLNTTADKVVIQEVGLDTENGIAVYEIDLVFNNKEYDYIINASDGAIISVDNID